MTFADTSADVFNLKPLWRAGRPLMVLLSAAGLAAWALHPGSRNACAATAVSIAFGLGVISRVLQFLGLPAEERHFPVFATPPATGPIGPRLTVIGLELGLISQVAWATTGLALVIYLAAWATDHFPGKIAAYFTGLLAGAAVGFFSQEIFKPSEAESWQAMHFRYIMARDYTEYFFRLNPTGGTWDDRNGKALWAPDALEADSLSANSYLNRDTWVQGWDHRARIARAHTIAMGLKAPAWRPT